MFPKAGKAVPKHRFASYTGDWSKCKLGSLAIFNPRSDLPEIFEYVDLESVSGTEMISHRTMSRDTAPSRAQRLARTGDLFFQTVRPYQRNNYLFEKTECNYVFSTGYAQMRPLIFGWAGKLVSWKRLEFEKVEIDTYPWRWHETNPELGRFLQDIRKELLPALDGQRVRLSIATQLQNPSLRIVPAAKGMDWSFLNSLRHYSRVLYITKWPSQQKTLCQMTKGIFQNDEPQNLSELFDIARSLDESNAEEQAVIVFDFLLLCVNHVNDELGSYSAHIHDGDFNFNRIKKHTEFGALINNLLQNRGKKDIYNILAWVKSTAALNIYRIELFDELLRALSHAEKVGCSIENAARQIRTEPKMQKRYTGFKFLSSRTVLSKGLEFECVVIDVSKQTRTSDRYCATDFYVALTRATKAIYLVTDDKEIVLEGLKDS